MGSLQHLLSHTNSGDVTVHAGVDDEDNLHVHRHYDYSNLLHGHDLAQQAKDAGKPIKMEGRDFWLVADIPAHEFDQAIREGRLNDRDYWRKWVNDPSNAAFVYERNGRKIRL